MSTVENADATAAVAVRFFRRCLYCICYVTLFVSVQLPLASSMLHTSRSNDVKLWCGIVLYRTMMTKRTF